MSNWKNFERQVAKHLNGFRRVRVDYGESCEDVAHKKFAIECKYGKQVPVYTRVKGPLELNREYYLIPSDCLGEIPVEVKDVGYNLEFLQRGMAQAQQYSEDKIPLLCLKPPYWNGFIMVFWKTDYLSLLKEFGCLL